MKIDRTSRRLAKQLFRTCQRADGSLDDQKVRDLFNRLATQKPRNYLAVLGRIHRLVEMAVEESTVRVESASPLPDRGAGIFAELEKKFGPASRTYYEENPMLLGGMLIQRGSNIWDGTLSGRLDRLKQALS